MERSMKIYHNRDVYAILYGLGQDFPIGRIKQDTLFLDSPSRHRKSNSYGIDKDVLMSGEMDYHHIIIRERKTDWTTTRNFWLKHGTLIDLGNKRNEIFLPDGLFGLERATLYESYISPETQKWIKLDIFDIAKAAGKVGQGWDNFDKLFPSWLKAIDIEEQYLKSLRYGKKIEL